MPATNGFGISAVSGALIESVEVNYESESKTILNFDGSFAQGQLSDITQTFTVRGSGTSAVSVGSSSGAPDFLNGTIIITSAKRTQTNEDFEKFEYSGTAYPNA